MANLGPPLEPPDDGDASALLAGGDPDKSTNDNATKPLQQLLEELTEPQDSADER